MAVNVVVAFEDRWSFADLPSKLPPTAGYVELITVSLTELMMTALVITFAVGTIVATLADAPVPPVPSFTNVTVSPTAYPSPPSTIVKSLMVESVTDATFTAASAPFPPDTTISSPTL